jgi:hypothetical protein
VFKNWSRQHVDLDFQPKTFNQLWREKEARG